MLFYILIIIAGVGVFWTVFEMLFGKPKGKKRNQKSRYFKR